VELVEFRGQYGHCNVSNKSVEHKSLGFWVEQMRRAYITTGRFKTESRRQLTNSASRGCGFQLELEAKKRIVFSLRAVVRSLEGPLED